MKLTKIIATIGPATLEGDILERVMLAGVDICRLNFKHGTVEWHSEAVETIRKVAKKLNKTMGILLDLQGPEIRMKINGDSISFEKGVPLEFNHKKYLEGQNAISCSHPQIVDELKDGQVIYVDDGTFEFTFARKSGQTFLMPKSTGILGSNKTMNLPGSHLNVSSLVEKDYHGLTIASEKRIDYIALSFVRTSKDIKEVRDEMSKYKVNADLISKIECKEAIDNLDEIINLSDGIMVARGDLGVELPYFEIPYLQKLMIKKCIEANKPVITATQMLSSMVDSEHATRAEVSDVANASYDLTDAVMLSNESASGKFPVQSVEVMRHCVVHNERKFSFDLRTMMNINPADNESKICEMAYNLYLSLQGDKKPAGCFLAFTRSGRTPRLISRYRPQWPIFALTEDKQVREKLTMNFGVYPIFYNRSSELKEVTKSDLQEAVAFLVKHKFIQKGDPVIILHGDKWSVVGGTSTVKLLEA